MPKQSMIRTRRHWLQAMASLGASVALSGCAGLAPGRNKRRFAPQTADLIRRENQRPGTRNWILSRTQVDPSTKYRCPWIEGYCCYGRIAFSPDARGRAHRALERVDIFGPPHEEEFKSWPEMRKFPFTSPFGNLLMGAHSTPPVTGGADWICAAPDHWLFAGTGMKRGEGIPGLVGWEWHGEPAARPGLEIVATGKTRSPRGEGTYTATVYPGPRGNVVFNAATCWWADGLSEPPGYVRPSVYTTPQGPDRRAQQITRNLLARIQSARWPG
jgi:hypothetical protein